MKTKPQIPELFLNHLDKATGYLDRLAINYQLDGSAPHKGVVDAIRAVREAWQVLLIQVAEKKSIASQEKLAVELAQAKWEELHPRCWNCLASDECLSTKRILGQSNAPWLLWNLYRVCSRCERMSITQAHWMRLKMTHDPANYDRNAMVEYHSKCWNRKQWSVPDVR